MREIKRKKPTECPVSIMMGASRLEVLLGPYEKEEKGQK